MFSAQNTHITGGSFSITNFNEVNAQSLELLHRRVSPNAILNAGGRADEVRCHPGTREEVIGRIEKWADTQISLSTPIFWLSGPAGAGKSAIMQTVAERCKQRGAPHANFFFFRADRSRSNASPLAATLLHQIILLYPSLRGPMATLISDNPLIFNSTLEDQLVQLIYTPLRGIQQSFSAYRPPMLLIDGLDESDSEGRRTQQQILLAFDRVLAENPSPPFCLLVASRDESHIRAAFNQLKSRFLPLHLTSDYSPEKDIRLFVNDQFNKVVKTHPLAYMLDSTWPSIQDVEDIVEKSSGQFIYAATVMRYIMDSSASPALSLERVQGAAQHATKSPFAQLDAIYSYSLSRVDDQEALKDILHAYLLIREQKIVKVERIPLKLLSTPSIRLVELLSLYDKKYTDAMVLSCLADLTPIAWYSSTQHELLFYHASFVDYLLDESRSREYFVNIATFNYRVLPMVWKLIESRPDHEGWAECGVLGLTQLQKLPPGLMNAVASSMEIWSKVGPWESSIFVSVSKLCTCDDDILAFRCLIREWINIVKIDNLRFDNIKDIPFGRRYFQMARVNSNVSVVPDGETVATLCPETDFDRHELALWLKDLFHHIHREIYNQNTSHYKHLLKIWISWAAWHNVPCGGPDNVPNAQWYTWRNMPKQWAARIFKINHN